MASVLVVDDEEGVRLSTCLFLKQAGHDVSSAGRVSDALQLMGHKTFDIVLSDIQIPGEDGIGFLGKIRNLSPLTQVIIFTGEPSLDTATDALRLGAFDYLLKPVRKDTLCRVVEKAATEQALRQENQRLHEEVILHREELQTLVAKRTGELLSSVAQREATLDRLNLVLESTTQALSMALEMRDPYTAGHQRRVTVLACAIWDRMRLPQEGRDGVRIAGLLHDLGKIRVPSDILSKPSKLTGAEFALIQEHPVSAWEILRLLDFPWPVADIVRQHHERLDGSGYPDHLKNENILQEARILGIADVVEAISSHRPYRPALGIDMALAEIRKGSGTIYDTDIVDACLGLFMEDSFALPA
jgi:putative nucleotidyltransferase with HDIG domain